MPGPGELLYAAVRWSGLPSIVRHTLARRRASILLYHDPTVETMEQHLRYLTPRYSFVALSAVVDALRSGDWGSLPVRPLVVTLDDGHRGNASLVDVFERYGVSPTIYVCTQIVGTGRHFWFMETDAPEALKRLPHERRLALLQEHGFSPEAEFPEPSRQALDATELLRLQACCLLESHTRSHPVLTTCDGETCRCEIELSRSDLRPLLGSDLTHFSYPNGDYTEREVALVRAAGYLSARTVDFGRVGPRTDPFRLPIVGLSRDDVSVNRLAGDLAGITSYLAWLRAGSPTGRKRPIVPERAR